FENAVPRAEPAGGHLLFRSVWCDRIRPALRQREFHPGRNYASHEDVNRGMSDKEYQPMHSVATGLVLIPGAVALLVFFVFTYLYEQNRHSYFRAWQLAWAAYTLHYAVKAVEYFEGPSALLFFLSSLLLVGMAICIFVSTRLMKEPFQLKWYDVALT